MKLLAAASLAALLAAGALSTANAQTVLNTDLPNANGTPGAGVTATTTTPNGTTTTTVGPSGDANRFYQAPVPGTWQQQAVGGGGTVGITKTYTNDGNGSAFLSTLSGDSKADLQYMFAAPVLLSDLTSMSFDFYRDSASTSADHLVPTMRLIVYDDADYAGFLVSEFLYQNNPQILPPEDTWVTQSATLTSGVFWATNPLLGPTFATAGGTKTLQSWIDDNPNDVLRVVGVNFGVGSGWAGTFSGAVDHVQFAFDGGPSGDFDFAVAPGAVPEPATWAMMIGGFAAVGGMLRRRKATALPA